MKGAFAASLERNNKQIRRDRAIAIAEDAELIYKREIEDLEKEIKTLSRTREAMLDLSPTDAKSLVLALDFDAKKWATSHIELGVKIRNLKIRLAVAQQGYNYLFTDQEELQISAGNASVNVNE